MKQHSLGTPVWNVSLLFQPLLPTFFVEPVFPLAPLAFESRSTKSSFGFRRNTRGNLESSSTNTHERVERCSLTNRFIFIYLIIVIYLLNPSVCWRLIWAVIVNVYNVKLCLHGRNVLHFKSWSRSKVCKKWWKINANNLNAL